jgi:TPR repeat protein
MRPLAFLLIVAALTAIAPRARAQYARAEAHFNARNFGQAYLEALPLAQKGDARAQYLVALMSDNGLKPVAYDPAEAVRWYARACGLKHGESCFAMARAYARGRGVQPDPRAALAFLQRAADAGNVAALLSLAQLHDEGRGVDKDPERATFLIRQAAEQDDARAHFAYAMRIHSGRISDSEWRDAEEWFRKAAAGGHPEAFLRLAERVLGDEGSAPERNVEAYAWATLAEQQSEGDLKKAAAKVKAALAKRMTPGDLEAASEIVTAWREARGR